MEIVWHVHFVLKQILEPSGALEKMPEYLVKGPHWDRLKNSCATQLVSLIGALCNCGVRAVQGAIAKRMEADELGLARPIAARTRGAKAACSSKGEASQRATQALFPPGPNQPIRNLIERRWLEGKMHNFQ